MEVQTLLRGWVKKYQKLGAAGLEDRRSLGTQSAVKYAPRGCTRAAAAPKHLAENVLNRRFYADRPNEKWLTDVTEFHY